MMSKLKTSFIQALIVIVPTYIVAYATEKMVYTIPMLAAMSFIAASIKDEKVSKRTDEEGISQYKESDTALKTDHDMRDGTA